MNATTAVWLGFKRLGGRFCIRKDELTGGIAALGEGANSLASLFAYACNEAGLNTLLLDLDGRAAGRVSGYMQTYGVQHFAYDSMVIDTNPAFHALLISSAYACAMDLAFEQEMTLNMVAQSIGNEGGIASPSALADMLETEDEVKGRPSAKLAGRFRALSPLNMVGDLGAVKKILGKSSVVSFSTPGSPEASEVACTVFIAKVLALAQAGEASPDVVVLTKANALFRTRPIFRQSQRLLSTFVLAPFGRVLCSEALYALDQGFAKTSYSRILSSAVWNESGKSVILTPNMFMFQNGAFGSNEAFIPREFETKVGDTVESSEGGHPNVDGMVLETILFSTNPTRESVSAYLATDFDPESVKQTIDRLQARGLIEISTRSIKGAGPIHILAVTEAGKKLIGGGA